MKTRNLTPCEADLALETDPTLVLCLEDRAFFLSLVEGKLHYQVGPKKRPSKYKTVSCFSMANAPRFRNGSPRFWALTAEQKAKLEDPTGNLWLQLYGIY